MDRNVEFVTQLSRLVALYAHGADAHAGAKATLRAARAAAKHGAILLAIDEGELRAGHQPADCANPDVAKLRDLCIALGITRLHVAHHAKQDEIERIARLLAHAEDGRLTPSAFAASLAAVAWDEIGIELSADVVDALADETPSGGAEPEAVASPAVEEQTTVEPSAAVLEAEQPAAAEQAVVEPAAAEEVAEAAEPVAQVADGTSIAEESSPPQEPVESGPLAERIPDVVEQLVAPRHRELFERLITSSEPGTLRRLLEPVQLAVEQTVREGATSEAMHLLQAMFACEEGAADPEMRRQFLVVLRRLTKPMLLRALAMLHGDAPEHAASVEQVLARFGEDGAEAVADRVSTAPTAESRAAYLDLLRRLPAAGDALLAMLDDDRAHIVERALALIVLLRLPDAERVLGEHLAHAKPRVRQAAARGLGVFTESSFAADALLRAVQDEAPDVRLTAAVALQSRKEARLAAALIPWIDDEPEIEVQLALVAALGRLAAPEGVQKLVAMSMPDQRVLRRRNGSILRLSAMEAMGDARTPQAMVTLQRLLEDREKEVREAAARLYTRARRQTTTGSIAVVE